MHFRLSVCEICVICVICGSDSASRVYLSKEYIQMVQSFSIPLFGAVAGVCESHEAQRH